MQFCNYVWQFVFYKVLFERVGKRQRQNTFRYLLGIVDESALSNYEKSNIPVCTIAIVEGVRTKREKLRGDSLSQSVHESMHASR
jgi:hypothetical protein